VKIVRFAHLGNILVDLRECLNGRLENLKFRFRDGFDILVDVQRFHVVANVW
jgi:hypothetical protein